MEYAVKPSADTDYQHGFPMRLWLAAPDWVFRAAGAAFFFAFLLSQAQKYWDSTFWDYVPYCIFPNKQKILMPWVPVLIDITFLQIAVAFCFRIQARMRAFKGWTIAYTLLTAFAPLIPVWVIPLLGHWNVDWQNAYEVFLWRTDYTWQLALTLGVVMPIGLSIEVWGYAVLARSLSIVPEARELKLTGPYRFVRHPIYFGQFIAMAGFLLIRANTHWIWISLYVLFVAMQLYRSKLEDRILAEAFGEPYLNWQRRTFWFV